MVNRIRGNRGDVETGMDWDMELNPFAEIRSWRVVSPVERVGDRLPPQSHK